MNYTFGSFRVDTTKRRLWRGDELLPLTPKAFDTLVVLMSRAGQVVEKDELLKAVWPDTFVEEATLAQNISTLRRALGDDAETPVFIGTVPRRGYRFLATVQAFEPHGGGSLPGPQSTESGRVSEDPHARSGVPGPNISANVGAARVRTPFTHRERWWMALSGLLAVALVFTAVQSMRDAPLPRHPVVFRIASPDARMFSTSGGFMALSPDGRRVAFVAVDASGRDSLWIRSLDAPEEREISGPDGVSQPFWAPDSQQIAFFAGGKLKRVSVGSAAVQTICDVPSGSIPLAGTWNRAGDILFSSVGQDIMRVPDAGGIARPAVLRGATDDFAAWPQFLPDGRRFLYLLSSSQPDRTGIYVGSLDSPARTRLLPIRSYALYASPGYLLFMQGGTLLAQRFDAATLKLWGDPAPVAERIAFNAGTARGTFSAATSSMLAYRTVTDTRLVWFDRQGRSFGAVGSVGTYLQYSLSPDGKQIAAARLTPQLDSSDIWIIDAPTGGERRFTFDPSWDAFPLWSRDGSRIAFSSNRSGRWEIYEKSAAGGGTDKRILGANTSVVPTDWSHDGRIMYQQSNGNRNGRFWLIGSDGTATALPDLDSDENDGRISPDGRWLAYTAYQAGMAVHVRPFGSLESRWQVSSGGGDKPRWRADGRELFYMSPELSVMAVEIEPGPAFRPRPAKRLFQTSAVAPSGLVGTQSYEVTPDGQRFLIKVPASLSEITIVVDWTSLLSARN